MRKITVVLAGVLAVCMALFAAVSTAALTLETAKQAQDGTRAALVDFGDCGDNMTWALYDTGELVITGTGTMANYTLNSLPPWREGDYRYENEEIKTVTIRDGVTSIGNYAFYGCTGLTSITIPEGVTSIGDYALFRCNSLASVTIPEGVTSIGQYAFSNSFTTVSSVFSYSEGDTDLEIDPLFPTPEVPSDLRIIIPDTVRSIGEGAFLCSRLTDITVSSENPAYMDIDGVLFTKTGETLLQYPRNRTGNTYSIPNEVTKIGNGAFFKCQNLTEITIPDSVTEIGPSAFYGNKHIANITIPDSVTSLGSYAFAYCNNLKDITYAGTEKQWSAVRKGVRWDSDTSYTLHYGIKKTFIVQSITRKAMGYDYVFRYTLLDPDTGDTTEVYGNNAAHGEDDPCPFAVGDSVTLVDGRVDESTTSPGNEKTPFSYPSETVSKRWIIDDVSVSGIRFFAGVTADQKAEEDEYGLLVSRKALLGDDELTFDCARYLFGAAYNKADGTDKRLETTADGVVRFHGFVYNIPASAEGESIVARPYLKIGTLTFYGAPMETSLAALQNE